MSSRQVALIVLCNRTGENLPRTRAKIVAMLGGPVPEHGETKQIAISASEFAKYIGTYRNGDSKTQITERNGKLFLQSSELMKGDSGWLIVKTADGRPGGRIFCVPGADGRIEYLHRGGRSSLRVQ
jgi:hypothetical protein